MSVSVIIPAWQAEKTLRPAVESVLSTKCDNLKILICVDGSEDTTQTVAASLQAEFPEMITVIHHPDAGNHGAGETRNLGLRCADTDYVAFLDVDDAYRKNRFERCLSFLQDHTDVDFVYEPVRVVVEEEAEASGLVKWDDGTSITGPASDKDSLLHALGGGRCWHFNGVTLRRSALDQVGLINKSLRLGQDIEWFIRLAAVCKGEKLSNSHPVATYRRHGANRSSFDRGMNMSRVIHSAYWVLRSKRLKKEAALVLLGYQDWLMSRCTKRNMPPEDLAYRKKIWLTSLMCFPVLGMNISFWKILYWLLFSREDR